MDSLFTSCLSSSCPLLSGIIILENSRVVNGLPNSLHLDSQMFLGQDEDGNDYVLTGIYMYYNTSNHFFADIACYFAWIHICPTYLLLLAVIKSNR